jgi:hypothetical protein
MELLQPGDCTDISKVDECPKRRSKLLVEWRETVQLALWLDSTQYLLYLVAHIDPEWISEVASTSIITTPAVGS